RPMMLSSVDLPQPDGPMTATNSPAEMRRLTSFSAAVSTSLVRKTLLRLSSSIIGSSFLVDVSLEAFPPPGPGAARSNDARSMLRAAPLVPQLYPVHVDVRRVGRCDHAIAGL